ncbi:MAG: hypothetical protein QM796_21630 [Chthoniobacteraceae bacterium]
MNQPTTGHSPKPSIKTLARIAFTAIALTSLSACVTKYDTQTHYLYPPKPKAPKTAPSPKPTPKPVVKVAPKPAPKPTPKPMPKVAPKPAPKPVVKTKAVAPKPAATPVHVPQPASTAEPTPKSVIKLTPFMPDEGGSATAPGKKPKPKATPKAAAPKATPSTKSAPAAAPAPSSVAGEGDFLIQYKEGVITKVIIKKKTGNRDLDRKSLAWIWAKFQVRKGATGASPVTLTWRDGSDRPTPRFY